MSNLETLKTLARSILKSGKYPDDLKVYKKVFGRYDKWIEVLDIEATEALIFVTMQRGVEAGMGYITALTSVVWHNNKACLYGDAAWAIVMSNPTLTNYAEKYENDVYSVTLERIISGERVAITRHFSLDDAKKAGLADLEHYKNYTERMLMIRARSWAMRDLFADVLNGFGIAEEQRDVELLTKGKPEKEKHKDIERDEFTQADLNARNNVIIPPNIDGPHITNRGEETIVVDGNELASGESMPIKIQKFVDAKPDFPDLTPPKMKENPNIVIEPKAPKAKKIKIS